MTRENKRQRTEITRLTAELARVKRQTKYTRLAGVTEDILKAEPDALYLVADFGQGWSEGKDLYLYFSREKFGGFRDDDEERAWFVRFSQEQPSPQFDDHDYVHGYRTYKWVSVPREDLGWRVELAIEEAEVASTRAEHVRLPPLKRYDLQARNPDTNLLHLMNLEIYDQTLEYMYEDA